MRSKASKVLLVGATLSSVACFSYAPVSQAPAVGSYVRIDIRPAFADTLARLIGAQVAEVDGPLVRTSDSSVTLRGERVQRVRGYDDIAGGTEVEVPRAAIAGFSARRFSVAKTALIIGGIAAVTVGVRTAGQGSGSRPSNGGGGVQ